jgi:hypothetical protein
VLRKKKGQVLLIVLLSLPGCFTGSFFTLCLMELGTSEALEWLAGASFHLLWNYFMEHRKIKVL